MANSWGSNWGEDGYFKIRRGLNDCQIERYVVGVWAQTDKKLEEMRNEKKRMQQRRRSGRSRRYHNHRRGHRGRQLRQRRHRHHPGSVRAP